MRVFARSMILLILLIAGVKPLRAQSSSGFSGTEFWVTFTENLYRPDTLLLLVAPDTRDTITVFNPQLNISLPPRAVIPGVYNRIGVPASMAYSVLAFGGQGTGIVVRSKRPVQLFAVNPLLETLDLTSVLPVDYLKNSQEYILHGWGGHTGKEAQVAIMAIDTGFTDVRVRLKADLFTGQGAGSTFPFRLRQGQVYLLQALDTQDLSGTIVRVINGCKRLAVFMGTRSSRIRLGGAGCATFDHLYEQAWPSVFLGKRFIVPPVPRNTRFQISVCALFDNTNVDIGGVSRVLNRGEVWKREVSSALPVKVEAGSNVSCVQLLNSQGCNGAIGNDGDPSLLNIAPVDLAMNAKRANYTVYRGSGYNHVLSILVKGPAAPVVRQNGSAITVPGGYVPVNIGGQDYWWGSIPTFPNNTYKLESDSSFIAYLYGIAPNESYATCAAAGLRNRKADFTINPNPVCRLSQSVVFTANGDSLNNPRWLFGDGNGDTGNPATHRYANHGQFTVKLINQSGGTCPTDTVTHTLRVLRGPDPALPRDTQPCRGSVYRIQLPSLPGVKYNWENGSGSVFRTFTEDREAILQTTDTNGCVLRDTISVKFRDCSKNDLRLSNVFTPDGDGKNDEWVIDYEGWEQIDVRIYNRWGELIARYSLPEGEHWNGLVMNKHAALPEGSYFYQLDCYDRETQTRKFVTGSITLIR